VIIIYFDIKTIVPHVQQGLINDMITIEIKSMFYGRFFSATTAS